MNTKLILHAKVFARMSPDHKAMLVEMIQKNNKFLVAMWGDGANDCKALKTADAGLSLSEAEASIAAPFTSKVPNISPMIELLKEGRASLVTSFNVFKFLWLYALIEYSLTVILYTMGSDMTTYEYIYIDLFIVIPVSMTMSNTEPYPVLSKYLPTCDLMSLNIFISVIGQTLISIGFMLGIYFYSSKQDWFVPLDFNNEEMANAPWICDANTSLFFVSINMFNISVIVLATGKPFRKPMYTNYLMILSLIYAIGFSFFLILTDFTWVKNLMEFSDNMPFNYRFIIIGANVINFILWYFLRIKY